MSCNNDNQTAPSFCLSCGWNVFVYGQPAAIHTCHETPPPPPPLVTAVLQNHIEESIFKLLLFQELFFFHQNIWNCSNIGPAGKQRGTEHRAPKYPKTKQTTEVTLFIAVITPISQSLTASDKPVQLRLFNTFSCSSLLSGQYKSPVAGQCNMFVQCKWH